MAKIRAKATKSTRPDIIFRDVSKMIYYIKILTLQQSFCTLSK